MSKENQLGGSFFIYKNIKQYFKHRFYKFMFKQEKEQITPKDIKTITTKNDQLIYKNRYVDFYNLAKIFRK